MRTIGLQRQQFVPFDEYAGFGKNQHQHGKNQQGLVSPTKGPLSESLAHDSRTGR
jgi:hypothetical protein